MLKPGRLVAERYSGENARRYEEQRSSSRRWSREHRAVQDMVSRGPVLDVPIGTGRYIPIYRQKNLSYEGMDLSPDMIEVAREKDPSLRARIGDARSIQCGDKSFGTVVCTRLLDWLPRDEMMTVVRELCRVGHEVVLTIRHGEPDLRVNYTHSINDLYLALSETGLHIAVRRRTEITGQDTEEIMLVRQPTMSDLLSLFGFYTESPEEEAQRLLAEWIPSARLAECKLAAEYWTWRDLYAVTRWMSRLDPTYVTDERPRHSNLPVVVARNGAGDHFVIDGRRRINQFGESDSLCPVLVIVA